MTTIHQLLKVKGHDYVAVGPSENVYAAIKLMADEDIGSLLIMDGGTLVGILTERHYARDIVLKGRTSPETLVREIMEKTFPCAEPDQEIEACLAYMTQHCVRHLPVVDGSRVVGIVSIGDLVKSIIDDQRHVIDQLEIYIHGDAHPH
jgi:CBS domain-containing protein